MSRILSEDDAIRRPHLVEYDAAHPSPHFSQDHVRYIKSIPSELSEKALANLRKTEWFILNRNSDGLIECAVPGLRADTNIEVAYIKRFCSNNYDEMMTAFLDCRPVDFPIDQMDHHTTPAYRLTSNTGEKFYPIKYNGNLPAWRSRLQYCAKRCDTLLGRFERGSLVLSDGRQLDLGDMTIAWVGPEPYPPDW